MSLQRVRQLWTALTVRLNESELAKVRQMLNEKEQVLFFSLSPGDQVHAYRVAQTAAELARKYDAKSIDRRLLQCAALLHDCGRPAEAGTPLAKTLVVLLDKFFPAWSKLQAEAEQVPVSFLSRVMYYHRLHPQLGAAKLRQMGAEREAQLVDKHHLAARPDDSLELQLLRQADEAN